MKRRTFIQSLALVPAAATGSHAQVPAPPVPQAPAAPAAQGRGGGPGGAPVQPVVDPVTYQSADEVGETVAVFFTAAQLSALDRLGRLLVPATSTTPGAVEAGAARFLDFYVGRSPEARQTLYRTGLDGLNVRARRRFDRVFGETDDTQADAIVMEYLSRPWTYAPTDPVEAFVRTAMRDLRRATQGSKAYTAAQANPPTTNWLRPL